MVSRPCELYVPGTQARTHEGPQFKLRLSKSIETLVERQQGAPDALEVAVRAVGEQLGRPLAWVRAIYKERAKWQQQCQERGFNEHGRVRSEAHLPAYLRTVRRQGSTISRAKGAGRKTSLNSCTPW